MAIIDASVVSGLSVLAGVIVGLGAPALTSRRDRRAQVVHDERETAGRILQMWDSSDDIVVGLRGEASTTRRQLLLLGVCLRDARARDACLKVISLAGARDRSDDEVLDAWSDMVDAVATTYRSSGEAAT